MIYIMYIDLIYTINILRIFSMTFYLSEGYRMDTVKCYIFTLVVTNSMATN
jgi:hypothetical protein